MFCSKCGQQISEDSNWCSNCGNAVGNNQQVAAENNQAVPQTHSVPKCTCCGYAGEFKPGPLIRSNDIIWMLLLLFTGFGILVYLAYILIIRSNPKNREKLCPNCGSKNMFTYLY